MSQEKVCLFSWSRVPPSTPEEAMKQEEEIQGLWDFPMFCWQDP